MLPPTSTPQPIVDQVIACSCSAHITVYACYQSSLLQSTATQLRQLLNLHMQAIYAFTRPLAHLMISSNMSNTSSNSIKFSHHTDLASSQAAACVPASMSFHSNDSSKVCSETFCSHKFQFIPSKRQPTPIQNITPHDAK